MHFDFAACTDVATYAVFDPAALLHVINDPGLERVDDDALAGEVRQGNLLLYSWGSDGHTRFRVFLDDEPPPDVAALARGTRAEGVLLRVPSGRLWAMGIEYLCRPGEEPVAPEEFEPGFRHMGQCIDIPSGDYLVNAFDVRTDEDAMGRPIGLLGKVSCAGCVLTLIGLADCILAPLIALVFGWEGADHWRVWGIALAVIWVPILIAWAIRRALPSGRQRQREKREREERVPFDAVVVLRPVPEGIDVEALEGGCFGSAV